MKIYDCFIFYNELDMLEIRLEELYDVVDYFVMVEWNHSHSGFKRDLVFDKHMERFAKYLPKLRYIPVIDERIDEVNNSTTNFWLNEEYQRNCIKRGLYDATGDDMVMLSDVDEIPYPETITAMSRETAFPRGVFHHFFFYNFATFRTEMWGGTMCVKGIPRNFQEVRGMRHSLRGDKAGGWHLSYFGNAEEIQLKLKSFAHAPDYGKGQYVEEDYINARIEKSEDLFMRPDSPSGRIDWKEIRLPKLVENNKERFALFLPETPPEKE